MKNRGILSVYIIITVIILILLVWAVFAFIIPNYDQRIPPRFGKANIEVIIPSKSTEVSLPFEIKGVARVFENVVSLKIEDETGKELLKTFTMASSPDTGQFGEFFYQVHSLKEHPANNNITLKVYWDSPKDGEPLDLVTIPLKLSAQKNKEIEIFFSNYSKDLYDCAHTFPVKRYVSVSGTPVRQALDLLLSDPLTFAEKELGYTTSIRGETKINSINLKDSTLHIDFNEYLDKDIAGSCHVSAIESQIKNTVYQFGVQNVILSINGRTEGILQP